MARSPTSRKAKRGSLGVLSPLSEEELRRLVGKLGQKKLTASQRIFTEPQAEAVQALLARWGPRHQVTEFWRRIEGAARAHRAHVEEPPMPMKGAIRKLRREYLKQRPRRDSALAVAVMGGKPGPTRSGRYGYIAAVLAVFEKATGSMKQQGRRDRIKLLRACLAPRLFWEKGRPLSTPAIVKAVKRIQMLQKSRPPERRLLVRHLFNDDARMRVKIERWKRSRLKVKKSLDRLDDASLLDETRDADTASVSGNC